MGKTFQLSKSSKLYKKTFQELGIYNLKTEQYRAIDTGFTSHNFVNFAHNGMIYCSAGSPTKFTCVVEIDPHTEKVSPLFLKAIL